MEHVENFCKRIGGGLLLDLGCGPTFRHTKIALKYGFNVCAMDVVKPRIVEKRIKFIEFDINKDVPRFRNKFDVVICTEIIEHIENPHKLFRDVHKMLKKGGFFS
ncbi:MAG: class I SAM-dependent methyltransferase [Candidatus Woesearchaeota archaeon]